MEWDLIIVCNNIRWMYKIIRWRLGGIFGRGDEIINYPLKKNLLFYFIVYLLFYLLLKVL